MKIRTRLRDENMELSPLFERYANHSERRADAGSSQSAGIALRHHLAFARHEFRSKTSDGFVCRLLLEMDLPGFVGHSLPDFAEV